jgi:2-polyprenyl-6-methoxyphenol hydroxylase-like FAD-dependent oxidoreductase
MSAVDTDILVVGAGPVGTTLAMDLARLGIESIVIERRRDIPPNPRCNTTNARSMELLRRLECADAVRAAGLPADFNTDVVYMTRLNGREISRYERSTPADVRADTQHGVAANWPTPEPQHFISQLFLEPILRTCAVDRWDVDLRTGVELVSFAQENAGVVSTIADVDTGEQRTIRSRYLVGCDGSGSIVRKSIGSRLVGLPRLNDMCSTYFRSQRVSELSASMPGWMLRSVGGGVLVAIDGDDGWLLHNGVPAGEDPETWDPRDAMTASIGEPFDYEIIQRSRWTPRAMVATKWRDGRVFLAGDAAHLWVPMGGFGMNAGMADAISLSWRLAGVLAGWAADRLLDTYQIERAPIGESIAGQAVTWALSAGALMVHEPGKVDLLEADTDEGVAARAELDAALRRDTLSEFECPGFQLGYCYHDSPIVCTDSLTDRPELMAVDYAATSWPGSRLPHVWAAGRSIFDLLGPGFTLLRTGVLTGDAIVAAAGDAQVPLIVVDVPAADVGDAWNGAALVLVRPDQHVAWRSVDEPSADDAADVVARVTGHAFAPVTPVALTELPADVAATQVADTATSPDSQLRYDVRADRSGVDQRRIHADGALGEPRPYVTTPVGGGLAVDAAGGVWVIDESVATRYDNAGRPTATAPVA